MDQVYAEVGSLQLRYDFFRPEGTDQVPLLIAIHGGGWISGCKEDMRDAAVSAVQRGFGVAIPQYRLAPLHPYPAAIEDLRAFVKVCRKNSELWKTRGIAAMGVSAGGHLASMVGLSPDPEERTDATVDICGLTDLTNPRERHFPISWSFIEQFLPWAHEGNEETYRKASPAHNITPGSGPFLIFHGSQDDIVPLSESVDFHAKLNQAGVKAQLQIMEGDDHGFSLGSWVLMEQRYLQFLREALANAE